MLHIQHTKYLNIIDYKFLKITWVYNGIFIIEHRTIYTKHTSELVKQRAKWAH